MPKLIVTIDVEPDIHSGKYLGITRGLRKAEKIFDKHNIKPILFVTADCIKKYPRLFSSWHKKGWEISLHGLSHKRFDEMAYSEKEHEITQSVQIFKEYLKIAPRGFRAPQHSIDDETLDLLEKYGFEYDSSYTPLNLLQLLFFPSKFSLWFKHFFSRFSNYPIRKHLIERPPSSFLVPFVSLPLRISYYFSLLLLNILKLDRKEILFYCHSWDFIKIPESRIDRAFSHERFIKNLDRLLNNAGDLRG